MDKLTLWAESPEEARVFLVKAARNSFPHQFERIFVAKRSPKNRSNKYIEGEYYETCNSPAVTVYDSIIVAPDAVKELVQWCTCDVMITAGSSPIVVVEDTTHIVRMNLYQRIPRLLRAAMLGVPAVALQGTRGLDLSLRGDCWAMHRYLRAFAAIARLYPDTPALPFYYIPTGGAATEAAAEANTFAFINALIVGDDATAAQLKQSCLSAVNDIDANGFRGQRAPHIQSIHVSAKTVTVKIGARPEPKSWKEKGSGQMDPYIGMIAAAKCIYCYDQNGSQVKEMVVEFTHLPDGFWWFKDWKTSRSLYKTLAFEIADRVEFLG